MLFAEFLDKSLLYPNQISFLNEVVEYLARNGVMGEELAGKVLNLVGKH